MGSRAPPNRAPFVTLFKTENPGSSTGSQIPLSFAHVGMGRRHQRAGIALTGGAAVPTPNNLAPRVGLEPTTLRLTAACSTD